MRNADLVTSLTVSQALHLSRLSSASQGQPSRSDLSLFRLSARLARRRRSGQTRQNPRSRHRWRHRRQRNVSGLSRTVGRHYRSLSSRCVFPTADWTISVALLQYSHFRLEKHVKKHHPPSFQLFLQAKQLSMAEEKREKEKGKDKARASAVAKSAGP